MIVDLSSPYGGGTLCRVISRPEQWSETIRTAGFRGDLDVEVPLAPLTTWRIGGPAELLATPDDRADVRVLVEACRGLAAPWRVLGNGSNLLVRDEGVRGVVIRIRKVLDRLAIEGEIAEAGAGLLYPALANAAADAGLAGLEFAAGIPGTVGGAVVMNAGWHEFETGKLVEDVDYLEPDGTVRTFARAACGFKYRSSVFRGRHGVILGARLALTRGEPAEIRARLETFAASRRANQPTHQPSCGSVFVQPEGDFAGRLIDAAGLKGTRVGAIEISPKHANFFVNLGGGTANEVLELVERVEDEIARRFGVDLEREFELW